MQTGKPLKLQVLSHHPWQNFMDAASGFVERTEPHNLDNIEIIKAYAYKKAISSLDEPWGKIAELIRPLSLDFEVAIDTKFEQILPSKEDPQQVEYSTILTLPIGPGKNLIDAKIKETNPDDGAVLAWTIFNTFIIEVQETLKNNSLEFTIL